MYNLNDKFTKIAIMYTADITRIERKIIERLLYIEDINGTLSELKSAWDLLHRLCRMYEHNHPQHQQNNDTEQRNCLNRQSGASKNQITAAAIPRAKKYNRKVQNYYGLHLRLVQFTEQQFNRMKAKAFSILNSKDQPTNHTIWIPNAYLTEDGTIHSNANLNWLFRKQENAEKIAAAGLAPI